jgi:hypothetical protein
MFKGDAFWLFILDVVILGGLTLYFSRTILGFNDGLRWGGFLKARVSPYGAVSILAFATLTFAFFSGPVLWPKLMDALGVAYIISAINFLIAFLLDHARDKRR